MSGRLADKLESLRADADGRADGYAFQDFVAKLFRSAQFEVTPNAGAAKPRQTDFVARRGDDSYLIEVKWEKRKVTTAEIDALLSRLHRTSSELVGLLISRGGYTKDAIRLVRHERARPILLFGDSELDELVHDQTALLRVLHRKQDLLVTHGVVDIPTHAKRPSRRKNVVLPSSTLSFLMPNGDRLAAIPSDGGYNKATFARDIPDIDWSSSGGCGVTLGVALNVSTEAQLLELLRDLVTMGWVREAEYATEERTSWSIQQATTNWHGHGCAEFATSVSAWRKRYEGVAKSDLHHSEEFVYFDACVLGYFVLSGQISADNTRHVRYMSISFDLRGVPVDDGAFTQFCSRFGVGDVFYRPRMSPSITRVAIPTRQQLKVLPVANVIQNLDGMDWVVGIVVDNPYKGQSRTTGVDEQWPHGLEDSGLLVCDLRSWHQLKGRKRVYRLRSLEWSTTADAAVVQAVADWDTPRRTSKVHGDVAPTQVVGE